MGKVYTRFQIKTTQNPTRWGGSYLYSLYKGVPPLPPAKIACFAKWVKGAKCILEPQESFLGHSMNIFLGLIGVFEFFHFIFLYANIFFCTSQDSLAWVKEIEYVRIQGVPKFAPLISRTITFDQNFIFR